MSLADCPRSPWSRRGLGGAQGGSASSSSAMTEQATARRGTQRRQFLLGLSGAVLLHGFVPRLAAAQDEVAIPQLAEIPTMGGRRPGPMSSTAAGSAETPRGEIPMAISIPNAAVDAPVERVEIVDGVMQNPSGPWVVSWYHDLATLGRGDNVVMAGHVDYWNVGPAVFWNLFQLVPGDAIEVVSEQDRPYAYAVEWMKNYVVAEMTAEDLDEMIGSAGAEALTLITCTVGSWDAATGTYRERTALRAMQT